jgi:hypothetical protein
MRTRVLGAAGVIAAVLTGCGNEQAPTVQPPPSTPASSVTESASPTVPPTTTTISATPTTTYITPTTEASLAGSRWNGTGSDGRAMTLSLRPDGQFDYTTDGRQRDTTPGNDSWIQVGSTLILRPNDAYATYTGVVNGTTYRGTARNVTGATWTFSFTRTN